MFSRQHHEDPMMGQLRAEIAGLDARLAADVTGIDDGGDPVSRQALSDAGERMPGRPGDEGERHDGRRAAHRLSTATLAEDDRVDVG